MSTFESMKSALFPLKIYSIVQGSNIYKELSVYCAELDRLYTKADEILREGFFATAESWGLERMERLWGNVRDDAELSKRREMCILRSAFGFGDFTPEGTEKLLKVLGTEGYIEEYPRLFRIVADLRQRVYKLPERQWIKAQLEALFPCHLEVDPVFLGFDWGASDEKALTFSQMEEKNMCWADIDIYSKE